MDFHGFVERKAPTGIPWVCSLNAGPKAEGDAKYATGSMWGSVFNAVLQENRGFIGNIRRSGQARAVDPQWESVGGRVGVVPLLIIVLVIWRETVVVIDEG